MSFFSLEGFPDSFLNTGCPNAGIPQQSTVISWDPIMQCSVSVQLYHRGNKAFLLKSMGCPCNASPCQVLQKEGSPPLTQSLLIEYFRWNSIAYIWDLIQNTLNIVYNNSTVYTMKLEINSMMKIHML